MNAKFLFRFLLLTGLVAGSSACIIRGPFGGYDGPTHRHSASSAGSDAGSADATSDEVEDEADTTESEFALQLAKLEHERSLMQIKGEMGAAQFALSGAKSDLQDAERALEEHKAERQVRLDEAQLDLDGSIGRAKDAELELAELQAMYDEEDFAEKTKELVLERGRRSLAHSKRRLVIAKERMRQLVEEELPGEERDLMWDLKAAKIGFNDAQRDLSIATLSLKIDSLQAEHDLQEALEEHGADS